MPRKARKQKDFFGSGKPQEATAPHEIWLHADKQAMVHLVVMASRAGGAVMFGQTRDGSAATLRLYLGGEGETFYAGDSETATDLMRHWAEQYEAHWEDAGTA